MPNELMIHAIGFDYDQCLHTHGNQYTISQRNQRLLSIIKKQNEHRYAASWAFLSSSRQSYRVNEVNRKPANEILPNSIDESSCFQPFIEFIKELDNTTHCQMLLSDAYAERPNGYSYTRAILKDGDVKAYHPDYIFNTYKSTILYVQTHTAAKLARSCDFVRIDSVVNNIEELYQIPFESNAAYVYINHSNKIYYINRVEKQIIELQNNPAVFSTFLASVEQTIQDEMHNFEVLDKNNHVLKGITLNDDQMSVMKQITGHQHIKKDYPIRFDFYDDQVGILDDLLNTFGKQQTLLPKNVCIGLHSYNVDQPLNINLRAIITGKGGIDLYPKRTLLNMALALAKKDCFDEYDYEKSSSTEYTFEAFIRDPAQSKFFKKRELAKPTVSYHLEEIPIDMYNSLLSRENAEALESRIIALSKALIYIPRFFAKSKSEELTVLRNLFWSSKEANIQAFNNEIHSTISWIKRNKADVSRETLQLSEKLKAQFPDQKDAVIPSNLTTVSNQQNSN